MKKTPYDVPMSQSQNAMEICSQQNRSINSSRKEGNMFSRVAGWVGDKVVGWTKDLLFGSQVSNDREEEKKGAFQS